MYKKSISLILAIATLVLLVGCSKETKKEISNDEVPKAEETIQSGGRVKGGEKLEKNLNGKYIHIVEDQDDTGSIYYFRGNEIVLLFGYHADVYKIENKKLDDNITYNLSTKEFGNPDNTINSVLNLSQNEDKTINMKWEYEDGNSFENNNLKILTAKECVQSIISSYPSYEHDRNWDDFGLTSQLFDQVYNEIYKEELSSQITEEKALELCKEKVKHIWGADYLSLGDNEFGLDKVIELNGRKYYGIYYIDDGVPGDFRFCVNISTGEVFYQDVSDLQSLTPINEYLQEFN